VALDHPEAVRSLALLDIVPTYDMFQRIDARTAKAYWHWYFLQWRQRDFIFGSGADYRATGEVDVRLGEADLHRTVERPALVLWGERGIARFFDMEQVWSARLSRMRTASLPSGHFFVDQFPAQTTRLLHEFLESA
jgi:haloacetate dehalogenase